MSALTALSAGTAPAPPDEADPFFAGFRLDRLSKRVVVNAGKAIKGRHPVATEDLIEAYRIAHGWRDGHLGPMRRIRAELSGQVRQISPQGIAAGRLKRFQSIRRKLQRQNLSLFQMQDIAGVRAIVSDIGEVNRLAAFYLNGASRHEVLATADDYIMAPKADGYRSRHLVLRFTGPENVTGGNRIVVEVQLRTQLQHAWATAVEAVGLMRNENLKAGEGDRDWLRFFELVSGEFAAEESCAMVPGVPVDAVRRRREMAEIAHRINAVATLEGYNQALRHIESHSGHRGGLYLVQFDSAAKTVAVNTYSSFTRMSGQAFNDELLNDRPDTLIVSLDQFEDLRAAYPNYFLDVRLFTERLKRAFTVARDGRTRIVKPATRWGHLLDFLHEAPRPRREMGGND